MNIIAFGAGAVVWWISVLLTRRLERGFRLLVAMMLVCFAAVVIAVPVMWPVIIAQYPDDSFWTLDTVGRLGVAAISAVGLSVTYTALASKSRKLRRWPAAAGFIVDLVVSIAIVGLVYVLSPQVFYEFYRLLTPDLPTQLVIDLPAAEARLTAALDLTTDHNLSDDLAGVAIWAVIPFTIWMHVRPRFQS